MPKSPKKLRCREKFSIQEQEFKIFPVIIFFLISCNKLNPGTSLNKPADYFPLWATIIGELFILFLISYIVALELKLKEAVG